MAEHQAYLERSGVCEELQRALTILVREQPRDPVAFLADHFESLVRPQTDPVVVATELVLQSTSDSVYRAFTVLGGGADGPPALSGGIQSGTFEKLLQELASKIAPPTIADLLLAHIKVADERSVYFEAFSDAMATYTSFCEYLKTVDQLYDLLCRGQSGGGPLERGVAEAALERLKEAVASRSARGGGAQGLFMVSQLLSTEELGGQQLLGPASKVHSKQARVELIELKTQAAEIFFS